MTTDKFIEENKTETFKKGDQVKMHMCHEATIHHSRIWTCLTDSFSSRGNEEVVFLECFSGSFIAKYLKKVDQEPADVSEVCGHCGNNFKYSDMNRDIHKRFLWACIPCRNKENNINH